MCRGALLAAQLYARCRVNSMNGVCGRGDQATAPWWWVRCASETAMESCCFGWAYASCRVNSANGVCGGSDVHHGPWWWVGVHVAVGVRAGWFDWDIVPGDGKEE
jgi:hypothetical protein